jgi:hypothetical protein
MPPKKACLATIGATGVVLASLVAGPAFAAAPSTTTTAAGAAAQTSAGAEPTITVLNVRDGVVLVDVQGTPHAMVTFTNEDRNDTRIRLDAAGHNTVDVRVANSRENVFQVTSFVAGGEPVEFEWRVDPRDALVPVDPENPVEPGTPGDVRAGFTVTGFSGDYADVALTGPAGLNYSVADAAGYSAGGGRFGQEGTARISLFAPEGAVSTYTLKLREGITEVESQPLVIERAAVDPGTPVDPEQPGTPGDSRAAFTVTSLAANYADVALTGPAGFTYGVTGADGSFAGGGTFSAEGTARISLEAPEGASSSYTLKLRENGTVVETLPIVIERAAVDPGTPVDPEQPGTPGEDRVSHSIGTKSANYTMVELTGPAGYNYGVSDSSNRFAGGGTFAADGTARISLEAPVGEVTNYTLRLREGSTQVGTHDIAIDRVGDVVEPPVVPVTPTPGEVVVGEIRDGVASVSMTGPFFASYMVHDSADDYVTGGQFEGFRKTIEVPAPAGVVSNYQLTIIGMDEPIEFSVDAR